MDTYNHGWSQPKCSPPEPQAQTLCWADLHVQWHKLNMCTRITHFHLWNAYSNAVTSYKIKCLLHFIKQSRVNSATHKHSSTVEEEALTCVCLTKNMFTNNDEDDLPCHYQKLSTQLFVSLPSLNKPMIRVKYNSHCSKSINHVIFMNKQHMDISLCASLSKYFCLNCF